MKKFYVGVKGVIVDEKKGALLLYKKGKGWDTPGGRINGNEIINQTLLRELSEELPESRLEKVGKLIAAQRIPQETNNDTGLFLVYFEVKVSLPDPVQLSAEHESYLWVKTKADIPKDLQDHVVNILRKILPE